MKETELRQKIIEMIRDMVRDIGRPDLYREPLVGFALADDPSLQNIKEIVGPWHDTPQEQLPGAKTVIAFSVPFTEKVAMDPGTAQFSGLIWSEAYVLINKNFDIMAQAVAELLRSNGYEAITVKTTNNYDPSDLVVPWSHRTAAKAAGLGDFGRNRILITEKGSAVRYCSLLTTAEFEPSRPYQGPRCKGLDGGECTLCLEACPVDALTRWFEGGKFACDGLQGQYHEDMLRYLDVDTAGTCGKCISVCPLAYIE
ncbi:MAG: epoxyqueuosine reductase [Firmicutes bacterium]|nr:epoxyqueuosine reductase [Bacillota bacterium]